MGAATITHAMQQYPDLQPNKVILEMPFGSLSDAVKGRVRMMGLPAQPLSTLLTFWGGTEQGFWAFGFQPSAYASAIHCPVLQQWGALDKRVTKQETDAVFNGIASKNKKLVVYPALGHQSLLKGDSTTWVNEVGRFLEN
jgi:pimeloyl-ACP methyl ester carboxylesterase